MAGLKSLAPILGAVALPFAAPALGLGGLSTLAASSLGAGLGTTVATGDLGKGIQAGLTSYLGGKVIGNIAGGADAAVGSETASGIDPNSAANIRNVSMDATVTPAVTGPETASFFQPASTSTATANTATKALSGAGAGISGMAAAYEPKPFEKETYDAPEAEARQVNVRMPGADYTPGLGPEFDYFGAYRGGIMSMQEGGSVGLNDKQVVDATVAAIKGSHPQPEVVLGEFLNRFGEEALRDLVRAVRSGEVDSSSGPAEGIVKGAGDGMEDLVPANLEGKQDVLLSEDEFVVPADVVSGLGNGSSEAGANRLYDMLDRVREARTGTTEQAPQINAMGMMPA